ncbi:hypothetical protein IPU70_29165 [Achromobacter sp. SD115]|uniref:AbiU2 domain-containing protein n=1 Tax=Achromobacter sp. SD115 TaxID=2782011 RepID=UPI001A97AA61|nr:hypothetical protein [Achromobacter sp. SD115]MBO1017660.1 hypothetical protein [Achromobacter sp. SD115]
MTHSKILGDLIDSAIAAKVHFDVWWAQASEAKPHLVAVMNEHSDFFLASYDAHYTAFFVNFAHLFDPRSDSSSIPTYFSSVQATADISALAALEAEFAGLASRARPLLKVRYKTVAHVEKRLTAKDVFAPLNITWNDVRDIIYESCEFVAKLASTPAGSLGIPRNRRLTEATLNMIRALKGPGV